MAEVINLRGESPPTPVYYNYEIHMKLEEGQTEPTVIKDY